MASTQGRGGSDEMREKGGLFFYGWTGEALGFLFFFFCFGILRTLGREFILTWVSLFIDVKKTYGIQSTNARPTI